MLSRSLPCNLTARRYGSAGDRDGLAVHDVLEAPLSEASEALL
jgi:hypothetical protein